MNPAQRVVALRRPRFKRTTVAQGGGGGAQVTPIFFSDFRAATGTTDTAKTDGAKWAITAGTNGFEVVSTSGLDFPSTNVLAVTCRLGTSGFHRLVKDSLGVPAENTSRWFRLYMRFMQPGPLTDADNHPIESGATGGEDWTINTTAIDTDTWRPSHRSIGDANEAPTFNNGRWSADILNVNQTYRFEWQVARLTGDEWNLHAKIFNSAGTQIAQDADYDNVNSSLTLANTPTLHLASGDGSNLDEMLIGNNGIANLAEDFLFAYQGCVAISDNDWCGAYGNVVGES